MAIYVEGQLKLRMLFYGLGNNLVECLWVTIRQEVVKMTSW